MRLLVVFVRMDSFLSELEDGDPPRASCCPWQGGVVGWEVTLGTAAWCCPGCTQSLHRTPVEVPSPSLIGNHGLRKS